MTRVGVVCPLPPCPSGPADWVADSADLLASRLDVVFLVDDPAVVRPDLRERLDVRPVAERHDPSIDVLIYHLANNPHHEFVYRAAMDGPPGLCEIHDGTLHHLINHLHGLDGDTEAYVAAGRSSHGDAGRDIVNMRRAFARGSLELFLFDLLPHVLQRHLGAIVHSEYAAALVTLDAPEVPTWLARLHAPKIPPHATKAEAGLPTERFVIGSFGYVAAPKRPLLLVEAFRRAVEAGLDGHLLFVGKDDTRGELGDAVEAAHLGDRVTITGFVDSERFDVLLTAVDAAVSLRAPHAGETSATLAYALAAGRPTVVQNIGSWSELPDDVVLKVAVDEDEAVGLSEAFLSLATDPGRRERLSRLAERYAARVLSPSGYCNAVVEAVEACRSNAVPPQLLRSIPDAPRSGRRAHAWRALLSDVPDWRQKVLAVACPAWVVADLTRAGHCVDHRRHGGIESISAGTFDLVVAPASPPGAARRAELASLNRVLCPHGRVLVCIADPECGGEALVADLVASGFSGRSPRLDDPPADLWPPPRGVGLPSDDHVVARKAGLPRTA